MPTKRLNEQVRRNLKRFPRDFMFQLTSGEAEAALRSRSQIATLKRGHNINYLPYAFTEHGAIMAANVLNSPRAVEMSVFVVRAFLKMRELLGGTKELARQLKALEAKLTARLDGHAAAIVDVLQRIMRLLDPPPEPKPPRRQIGFHAQTDDELPAERKAGEDEAAAGEARKRSFIDSSVFIPFFIPFRLDGMWPTGNNRSCDGACMYFVR